MEYTKTQVAMDSLYKILEEGPTIGTSDKGSLFAISTKLKKVFGDDIVASTIDKICADICSKVDPPDKPLSYYVGWLKKEVLKEKKEQEEIIAPIADVATKLPYCNILDVNGLRSRIREMRKGYVPDKIIVLTNQEMASELFFIDRVLTEWEFITNTVMKIPALEQYKTFVRYTNYRNTQHWQRDYEKHILRMKKCYGEEYAV